jgi:extracellular elastinolytic metalloproteinase
VVLYPDRGEITGDDGTSPVMNMGLVTTTGRHTCFDSDVVFHEFTHGVSNRLVGGGILTDAMDSAQSKGTGEGISDITSCLVNKKEILGDWILNNQGGIRSHPYDSNYPKNFGDLPTMSDEHGIGELWCATILEMNRNIKNGSLTMQLMVDALKISQPNPSFLNMRDAILMALDDKLNSGQINSTDYKKILDGTWKAFAKYGLGPPCTIQWSTIRRHNNGF